LIVKVILAIFMGASAQQGSQEVLSAHCGQHNDSTALTHQLLGLMRDGNLSEPLMRITAFTS